MNDTTDRILVVVERNERIAIPSLTENLGSFKRVGVLYTVNSLARSDAVSIVGVSIAIKGLKLCLFLVLSGYLTCVVNELSENDVGSEKLLF